MRTVVLGIGNVLMCDDGVGVHAVEALERRFDLPDMVEIVDGGTTGMELLPALEGAENLIVIDAVRVGRPPASVVRLADDAVPAFFKTKLSPHQVGLSDVLAALRFEGRAPAKVVLIGVQPERIEMAMELSPAVAARLQDVVQLIAQELADLGVAVTQRPLEQDDMKCSVNRPSCSEERSDDPEGAGEAPPPRHDDLGHHAQA
jgi:hydrogenase maturation protease